jgi:hypothetical protein
MLRKLAVGASAALLPIVTSGCVLDAWAYGAQSRNAPVIYNHNGSGMNYTGSSGGVSYDTCVWIVSQRLGDYVAGVVCQVHVEWWPGSMGYVDLSTSG